MTALPGPLCVAAFCATLLALASPSARAQTQPGNGGNTKRKVPVIAAADRLQEHSGDPLRIIPAEPRLGDIMLIHVDTETSVDRVLADIFGYEIDLVRVGPNTYRGIAAVPMDVVPRSYLLTVTLPARTLKTWIRVRDRKWRSSVLTVSQRFTRKEGAALRKRIEREEREWDALWGPIPTDPKIRGRVVRPVPGEVTATFGDQRVFNGVRESVHYGLDLNGDIGTPIRAAAAGRVVMSSMRWTSGGTIVLDHGNGLFTAYFHLSRRDKDLGEFVRAGARIGAVGSTGRVTGPHLHLAVLVRMVQKMDDDSRRARGLFVEPEAFLELSFEGEEDFVDAPEDEAGELSSPPPPPPTPVNRRVRSTGR